MHKGVPAQGLQILAAPSSMDARSVWILLGKKAHPSLAYIWTDMPVTCVLPYEKQLAGQKSLSAKYCKLIQNNIHLKAPGYTVRKHSRYSKQIIFFAYKGAATWSNHHSWQEHRTECQESWPCHFKGDPGHVFLGFNIHLFNKYLLSDSKVTESAQWFTWTQDRSPSFVCLLVSPPPDCELLLFGDPRSQHGACMQQAPREHADWMRGQRRSNLETQMRLMRLHE